MLINAKHLYVQGFLIFILSPWNGDKRQKKTWSGGGETVPKKRQKHLRSIQQRGWIMRRRDKTKGERERWERKRREGEDRKAETDGWGLHRGEYECVTMCTSLLLHSIHTSLEKQVQVQITTSKFYSHTSDIRHNSEFYTFTNIWCILLG